MPAPAFRKFGQRTGDTPLPGTEVATSSTQSSQSQAAPARQSGRRANRYGAKCVQCNGWVEAEAGYLAKTDTGKWAAEHVECPTVAQEAVAKANDVVLAQTVVDGNVVFDGIYTVPNAEGHRTFRLRTQSVEDDFMPGRQIIQFLSGPDNTHDYTSFGHVMPNGTVKVWKRHLDNDRLIADAVHFLADPNHEDIVKSVNCYACGRTLTVPASVHNGLGPECSKKARW